MKVADLKLAIVELKKLNFGEGFDLETSDAANGDGKFCCSQKQSPLCFIHFLDKEFQFKTLFCTAVSFAPFQYTIVFHDESSPIQKRARQ